MLIYRNTKSGFMEDVRNGMIARKVENEFAKHNIGHNNDAEYRSWSNSLQYMRNVLDDEEIPSECNIAIEYQIPLTSKRVDFLIAGSSDNSNNIIVVELKQWEISGVTSRPDVVTAYTGGAERAVCHPSYQAYSYAKIIDSFNEAVITDHIKLQPCAYLHNYKEKNRKYIDNDLYKEAISYAPLFLEEDTVKLRNFIKQYIKKKDDVDLLMKIDYGKLKPAKALQDSLASMLKGNEEFYLIDEQKVAYETVKKLVSKAIKDSSKVNSNSSKYTVIIEGGPGTGKSVIAIKLLCDLIAEGFSANYVTKNAAPRKVYFEKFRQNKYKMNYIKALFKSSDSFWNAPSNMLDCLIIDEAHRLRKKSSMFHGENQVKEAINASRVSVFLIDECQKITTKDIGTVEEIKHWAKFYDSTVFSGEDLNLVSQFRCNGSDGYLAFLDNMLEIKQTANYEMDMDYDIKLFSSASKMREALKEKNDIANKSRMIAGYCYEWVSRTNPKGEDYDIVLDNGEFKAKWNFENSVWAIDQESFEQVGCIHTSQGLEFDYCGIIIGKDLYYKDGHVLTDQSKEAKSDKSSGVRSCKDKVLADSIIRNTYRTLLSRGQKGCYIYCEDKPLLEHMAKMLHKEIL